MKLKYFALILLPFGLMACQSSDLQKAGDLAVSVLQQQNADQNLMTYQWSTTTANAPKPILLNFAQNGRLSISTSCNNLMGSWKITDQKIVSGHIASTLMGCEENAMTQENLAKSLFNQTSTPFVLNLNNKETPTLTLISNTGEKIVFTGKMTPESKYQSEGETIFLEVSPETKSCTGVAPQTCLQVREVKYDDKGIKTQVDKDWTLFYNSIEGFQPASNLRQIIRVKRYELKNPAADQSKYAYIYDMTVESEAVKVSP